MTLEQESAGRWFLDFYFALTPLFRYLEKRGQSKNIMRSQSRMPSFSFFIDVRQLRKLKEGARYHVTARANRQLMVLGTYRLKELFQGVIRKAKKKYRFRIDNFCIMGNHYHLIIQPGAGENLSRIMQWIMSRFATAYNRRFSLTGHVWGGRFYSKIIHTIRDLIHTFNYIDHNPVKAGLAFEARDWQYGALRQSREGNHTVVDRLTGWMLALFPERQVLLLGSAL